MIAVTVSEVMAGGAFALLTGVTIVIEAGRRRALRQRDDARADLKDIKKSLQAREDRDRRMDRERRERDRSRGYPASGPVNTAKSGTPLTSSRSATSSQSRGDDSLANPLNPISPLNPIHSTPAPSSSSSRSSSSWDDCGGSSRSSSHDSGSSYSGGSCSSSSSSSSSSSCSSDSGSSSCD